MKIIQISTECYRLNYCSFELLHMVQHEIVQTTNSSKINISKGISSN